MRNPLTDITRVTAITANNYGGEVVVAADFSALEYMELEQEVEDGNDTAILDAVGAKTGCVLSRIQGIELIRKK